MTEVTGREARQVQLVLDGQEYFATLLEVFETEAVSAPDADVLDQVAVHFRVDRSALDKFQVMRPETGHLVIMEYPSFGGTRE